MVDGTLTNSATDRFSLPGEPSCQRWAFQSSTLAASEKATARARGTGRR